jgi:hypothetical protein
MSLLSLGNGIYESKCRTHEHHSHFHCRMVFTDQKGLIFDASLAEFLFPGPLDASIDDFVDKEELIQCIGQGVQEAYENLGLEEGIFREPLEKGIKFELLKFFYHPINFSFWFTKAHAYRAFKAWLGFNYEYDSHAEWEDSAGVFQAMACREKTIGRVLVVKGVLRKSAHSLELCRTKNEPRGIRLVCKLEDPFIDFALGPFAANFGDFPVQVKGRLSLIEQRNFQLEEIEFIRFEKSFN